MLAAVQKADCMGQSNVSWLFNYKATKLIIISLSNTIYMALRTGHEELARTARRLFSPEALRV